jgi:Ca-activated chloride channel family protein
MNFSSENPMRFADPIWLLIGFGTVIVLSLLLVRAEVLKSRALALLGRARLRSRSGTPSRLRRWLGIAVTIIAVCMCFVALARPQKGMHWETVERNGTDLLLVVDTSKSMDADDVKPTRLERSKLAIRDLVDRFPGDRIGLVAFAGDAFVQSPMTLDHEALLESVDALDTSTIARGGTNIGRGIDVAADALATEPGNQKVMVLLTDGEDLAGQGLDEAKRAALQGIVIDTVGVGTLSGELVPARDERGAVAGVMRDQAGNPVRSRLDEAGLEAIASATHGSYRPLGADGRGLDRLYDDSLAKLTHAQASTRTHRVYSEWFAIPLGLGLSFLLIDSLLERRWRGLARLSRTHAPTLAAATAFVFLAMPSVAHASIESAAKAYAAGNYEEAAKEFAKEGAKNPKDARLAFNAGDAAYRAGHFDAADAAFKSALAAADPRLQQCALYNEGDVLYRAGAALKPAARDDIIAKWKAAVAAYDGAIALDAKDKDAIFNRDFVNGKLKALEEKKDQPPPPSKSDSKDDKKNGGGSGDKNDKSSGDKNGKGDSQKPNADNNGKSPAAPNPAKTGGSAAGNAPPQNPNPTSGAPQNSGAQNSNNDANANEGAGPGHLSAKDARALLNALRGDEQKGVSHGTANAPATDDAPGKDW